MDNIVEKVASGLRRMSKKPDFFMFCDSDTGDEEHEWTWDEDKILGIPVLHSCFISNTMTDVEIPFIPIWKSNSGDWIIERDKFHRGYDES